MLAFPINWDHYCSSLAGELWRASWQGELMIAGVYAVCRIGRRLPASLRAFLWWLVGLKLLLSLCGLIAIPLTVLPSSPPPVARAIIQQQRKASALLRQGWIIAPSYLLVKIARVQPAPAKKAAPAKFQAEPTAPASAPEMAPALPAPAPRPPILLLPVALCALWALGVILFAALSIWAGARSARLIRHAADISGDDLAVARAAAERMCLARLPRIVRSDRVQAVFVAGLFRPTIVLPGANSQALSPDETRMALAHEMAHLLRRDLWMGFVPVLARLLFFFHPLAWLAFREYCACREEACDLLALRATGLTPASYGHLLIKMAARGSTPATAWALPISPAYRALRRRLETIGRGSAPALRPAAWLAVFPALVLLCLLAAPWRLVAARAPHPAEPSQTLAPRFALRDLGSPGPGAIGAVAMSDDGQLAATAQSEDGDVSYAYIVTSGSAQPLGSLPRYAYCRANAINSAGVVAASSYNRCEFNHAFVWEPGGELRLKGWPGFSYSKALGINDLDQVAGYVQSGRYLHGERVSRAALWVADRNRARPRDLGTLGGPFSAAMAIDDLGQVVGKADTSTPHQTHAFLWESSPADSSSDARMVDLGALPGGVNSEATAINGQGEIVGCSQTAGVNHAFLWQDGRMTDLGTLPGAGASQANAINDPGEVVGQVDEPGAGAAGSHAVLWANGRAYDLNSLVTLPAGWVLQTATAITNSGQIAGIGLYGGKPRLFVLTPALPPAVKV